MRKLSLRRRVAARIVVLASFAAVLPALAVEPSIAQTLPTEVEVDHELPRDVDAAGTVVPAPSAGTPLGSDAPASTGVFAGEEFFGSTVEDAVVGEVAAELADEVTRRGSAGVDPAEADPAELVESFTEFSHEYTAPNGQTTLELYEEPVFREEADGEWVPLSAEIEETPAGLVADEMLLPVEFGEDAEDLVTIGEGDEAIVLEALDLDVAEPELVDGAVLYDDVASGVDLRYTTTTASVKEEILLEGPNSPSSYRFHLSDPEGRLGEPVLQEDGGWLFTAPTDDATSFRIPPAIAWDAPVGNMVNPMDLTVGTLIVEPAGDGYDITVGLDPVWLADPTRRFPVTLDPTLYWWTGGPYPGPSIDGYAIGCLAPASCNYAVNYGDIWDWVGNGYDTAWARHIFARSYMLFDLKGTNYVPDRAAITSATFQMFADACLGDIDYCYQHNFNYQFYLERMTQAWSTGWAISTLMPLATTTGRVTGVENGPDRWVYWDVKNMVQSWVNFGAAGYAPNYGFQLREPNDQVAGTGSAGFSSNRFTSLPGFQGSTATRPALTIVYTETTPGAPTAASAAENTVAGQPTTGATINFTRPTTGTEPDRYEVRVIDADTNAILDTRTIASRPCPGSDNGWNGTAMINQGCTGAGSLNVPNLGGGHTYRFQFRAGNIGASGTQWSAWANVSGEATMWLPPVVTLAPPTAGSGSYAGDQATWTVNVQNPNDRAFVASVWEALPAGTTQIPGSGRINNTLCGIVPTVNDLTPGTCTHYLATNAFVAFPNAIAAGATTTVKIDLTTITGLVAPCSPQAFAVWVPTVQGPATSITFNTTPAPAPCGSRLGYEPWWTTVSRPTGPNGTVAVNVADGNLIAQHVDSTPIQGNGQLAYVLRRTYNSQAGLTVPLSGTNLGQRWNLNVAAAGDLVSGGITADGLLVPLDNTGTSPLQPRLPAGSTVQLLASSTVTLVDRDGTRHAFTPTATSLDTSPRLLSAGLNLSDPNVLQGLLGSLTGQTVPGLLAGLKSTVDAAVTGQLLSSATNLNLCISTAYQSPRGVHLSLWRYVVVQPLGGGSSACLPAANTSPVVVGYATMRPDRVRQVFDTLGRLVAMYDRGGNELRYTYGLNGLAYVWEPATCPVTAPQLLDLTAGTFGLPADCRALRFTYPSGNIQVVDPAGRTVVYQRTGIVPSNQLTAVRTYDGPTSGPLLEEWKYLYKGDTGTEACTAPSGVLCTIVAPRYASSGSNATRLTYEVINGLPWAKQISEPVGGAASTTFDYRQIGTTSAFTDVVRDGRAHRYASIDGYGRVAAHYEGTLASPGGAFTALRATTFGWDSDTTTCRPQDNKPDHNVCSMFRLAGAIPLNFNQPAGWAHAVDRATFTTYTPQGDILVQTSGSGSTTRATTYGYSTTYYPADGSTPVTHTDTPAGWVTNGARTNHAPATPVPLYLYATSDRTHILGPNGNVAGASVASFISTYTVDSNAAAAIGTVGSGLNCGQGNSGLVCVEDAPEDLITRHTYDAVGRRATTQEPTAAAGFTDANTCADLSLGSTRCATRYIYESPGATDVTGQTDAEGWLRGVVDPYGNYVAYAYDRAGNVVRAWDRDATAAYRAANLNPPASAFPTNSANPPAGYTETRFNTGTFDSAAAHPWRYLRRSSTPTRDETVYEVDLHGNVVRVTPPRGVLAGTTAFDTTTTYDANDRPINSRAPLNSTDTIWTYDGNGNVTAITDPRGHHTVTRYDAVNRSTDTLRTRGEWGPIVPATCQESSTVADRGPIPTGLILCVSRVTYDGFDQTIRTADAADGVVYTGYDPFGRATDTFTLRTADDPLTTPNDAVWLRSRTVFDPADNATSICGPRQFTDEPAAPCTPAAAHYSTHTTYDPANRPVQVTGYREAINADGVRQATWATLTSATSYSSSTGTITATDRRGNQTTTFLDLNGRIDRLRSPFDADPTNTPVNDDYTINDRTYSPAGDVLAVSVGFQGTPGQIATPTALTSYRYDAAHRLVDTVEAATSPTSAAINGPLAAGGTNPENVRTRVLYDADSNPVAVYEPRAFRTSIGDPDERYVTRTDFDAQGRAVATWTPYYDAADHSPIDVTFEDNQCPASGPGHQPDTVAGVPGYPSTVGICVTRTTEFDANGNPLVIQEPTFTVDQDRYTELTWTHDNLLARTSTPSPTGIGTDRVVEEYFYDAAGRSTRVHEPHDLNDATFWSTQTTYSPDGLPIATQSPAGVVGAAIEHRTSTTYNAAGQPTNSTAYANTAGQPDAITLSSYYADGLPYEVVTPVTGHNAGNLTTRYGYDPGGNPTSVWSPGAIARAANNPGGLPTRNEFADAGLLAAMVEPIDPTLGTGGTHRATRFTYDAVGRKVTETTGEITGINPWAIYTDPAGTQRFDWSANGWLRQETGRNGEIIRRTFEPNGLVTSLEDVANASTITNTWFLNGWLRTTSTAVAELPAYATETVTFKYHADGLEAAHAIGPNTSGTNPTQTTSYTYNDARVITTVDSAGWGRTGDTWAFTYDPVGRPQTMVDPYGRLTEYRRDGDGANVCPGNERLTPPVEVDSPSDPDTIANDDGLGDGTLRCRIVNTGATAGDHTNDLDRWSYRYDGLNRVTQRQRAGTGVVAATDNLHYDQAGRLDIVNAQNIAYDPNGNRINDGTNTTAYRADNSVLRVGSRPNYDYTAFGGVSDDACNVNTYDGFGRLTSTNVPAGRACPNGPTGTGATTTYDYDGLDRQTRTTIPAIAATNQAAETRERRYVGHTGNVYTDTSTIPDRTARYTTTNGQAIGVTNAATTPTFHALGSDGQGSNVLALNSTGVACSFDPDPWGVPRFPVSGQNPCRTGTTPNTRWYQDASRDTATGNYQFGSRTYTPSTGTWLQPDNSRGVGAPADLSIGTDPLVANRYSYVNGDPINLSDPTGHIACPDGRCNPNGTSNRRSPTVREDQDKLTSDDGFLFFLAMDVGRDGDINDADNNFSREDVEGIAAGGDHVEDIIRDILDSGDVDYDQAMVEALAGEAQRIARNLLTEDNSWEEIDTDRPNGLMSFAHNALDIAGFIPGIGAVADIANAALYALEGDWVNAAISVAGVAFEAATAMRGVINGIDAIGDAARAASNIHDATRAIEAGDAITDAARLADEVTPRLPDAPQSTLSHACSFSGATLIRMADGSIKAIADVEVGDLVAAENPETGERGPRAVTRLWLHEDELVDLELADGSRVSTTEDHPFWNATDNEWQRADALDSGDLLLSLEGDLVAVQGLDFGSARSANAYNLTVDDIHTYFVRVGADDILVHNNNTCDVIDPSTVRFTQDSASQSFRDGGTVQGLADGLRTGDVSPGSVSPVRLVEHQGSLFSLDNRRLIAFQEAGVAIPYRMATPREVRRLWDDHYTTLTGGQSIQLRLF